MYMTGTIGSPRSGAIALRLLFKSALLLLLICFPTLLGVASITDISPPAGHPGDGVQINGTGFGATPSANVVRFGPNRAAVLAATVELDHEGGKSSSSLRRDNKLAVVAKNGDMIYSASTRSLGSAVKDACHAIRTGGK
jgi:hypothetical protein